VIKSVAIFAKLMYNFPEENALMNPQLRPFLRGASSFHQRGVQGTEEVSR